MRVLLILNPLAGVGKAKKQYEALVKAARAGGHTVDLEVPDSVAGTGRAAERGVAERYDRMLVAGGDGTINQVVPALAGSGVPLGIIPVGSVNVLARELGLPLDPLRALEVALDGPVRTIDLGSANGRLFTLMAGLGFDAQVVAELPPKLKEQLGSLAYITTGMQTLTQYRTSQLHLEFDNHAISCPAWLLVVGNAGYYAYQLELMPSARLDDGLLDVCLFAEHNALDRLTQLGAVFIGQHAHHPSVSFFRTRTLRVTADPPVALQLDGDPAGSTPVEITIRPGALQVAVIPPTTR